MGDTYFNMGLLCSDTQKYEEALQFYEKSLAIYRKALGEAQASLWDIGCCVSKEGFSSTAPIPSVEVCCSRCGAVLCPGPAEGVFPAATWLPCFLLRHSALTSAVVIGRNCENRSVCTFGLGGHGVPVSVTHLARACVARVTLCNFCPD